MIQAVFKTCRNLVFDSSGWKINPWELFSPPITGSVRDEVRYFISIQSGCILVKIGHGTRPRLARRTSGPYAHPQAPPLPFTPSSPFMHARIHVILSFGSSSSRDWSLQHNSSRRHEHKYYDRRLFMRIGLCSEGGRRWRNRQSETDSLSSSIRPISSQRDKVGDLSCRGGGSWVTGGRLKECL